MYKFCVSPFFGDVCRFEPSCSDYALDAFSKHGILKGSLLSLWRILRCNPWAKSGLDPVPEREIKQRETFKSIGC